MKNSRRPSRNTPVLTSGAARADSRMESSDTVGAATGSTGPPLRRRQCPCSAPSQWPLPDLPPERDRHPPTEAPRPRIPAPASSPCPSRTGRRPAQWGSEPVRRKMGRNGWRCPQAGAPQRWRQGVRLLRYTVWFFPYNFPLLPLRRDGCSAFLLIFIYVGSAAHRAAAGKVMRMTVPSPGLLVRRMSPW